MLARPHPSMRVTTMDARRTTTWPRTCGATRVARWTGTLADLPLAPSNPNADSVHYIYDIVECDKPWQTVDGLDLPTAMHARALTAGATRTLHPM